MTGEWGGLISTVNFINIARQKIHVLVQINSQMQDNLNAIFIT